MVQSLQLAWLMRSRMQQPATQMTMVCFWFIVIQRRCMTDTLRYAVAPRRRSKRITMKRQRDTSDEEDEVLDYQQSPAKKPRKRADSKAKRPKSTKVGNVTSTAPLSSVQQARMGNEVRETTKGPVLKTGKTQSVVRGSYNLHISQLLQLDSIYSRVSPHRNAYNTWTEAFTCSIRCWWTISCQAKANECYTASKGEI